MAILSRLFLLACLLSTWKL
uniref:Uncharacterized protein n=1 Tax=Rhizophora mucronata TaxID=61149 RepID=A0A2P2Q916_RHIMU